MKGTITIGLFCVVTAAGPAAIQQPVTKTGTIGIVIDASVIDRRGQPVLDLRPDEFELSEDGVRQQILSVTLIHNGVALAVAPAAGGASAAAPAAAMPVGQLQPGASAAGDVRPSVTAILFDRLSPEARPLAQRSALAYVSTLSSAQDYAGVFLADISLATFQPFTNEPDKLRLGIDRLAATAPSTMTAERTGSGRIQSLPLDASRSPTAGAESGTSAVTAREREALLNVPGAEGMFRRLEVRMFEGYQQFLTEYEGQASLAGLTAVVDALGTLPGRKSVLYFTEQLPLTQRVKPRFDGLIGLANRHNITIYAVDAVGLRVHSKEAELGRRVDTAGGQGLGDVKRSDGAWTKDLEQQEQMLVSRPTAVLGRLAKETGGFLIENTNDLSAGVARMRQERITYYELGYQPTQTRPDGKFRKVSVKVKRPQTTVRTRPGYAMSAAR
jgi:VWFA-related protein